MKQQLLALLMLFSVILVPTQTSAVSVGTVAYKVAAGCGGIIFAKAAIGFGLASIYTGAIATISTVGCLVHPSALVVAIPAAGISAGTGLLSYGCAVLSYRCFKEMLASHPDVVHVHHHHYSNENNEDDDYNFAQHMHNFS